MSMLKLFNGHPSVMGELLPLMREIEEEVKPMPILISDVDAIEIYRVYFNRPAPAKGTWMEIDSLGNLWLSSKKEGKRYDVIPHDDLDALIMGKTGLENVIGFIGVNRKYSGPYIRILSLPTDEHHLKLMAICKDLEMVRLCDPAVYLHATKNRKGFTEFFRD